MDEPPRRREDIDQFDKFIYKCRGGYDKWKLQKSLKNNCSRLESNKSRLSERSFSKIDAMSFSNVDDPGSDDTELTFSYLNHTIDGDEPEIHSLLKDSKSPKNGIGKRTPWKKVTGSCDDFNKSNCKSNGVDTTDLELQNMQKIHFLTNTVQDLNSGYVQSLLMIEEMEQQIERLKKEREEFQQNTWIHHQNEFTLDCETNKDWSDSNHQRHTTSDSGELDLDHNILQAIISGFGEIRKQVDKNQELMLSLVSDKNGSIADLSHQLNETTEILDSENHDSESNLTINGHEMELLQHQLNEKDELIQELQKKLNLAEHQRLEAEMQHHESLQKLKVANAKYVDLKNLLSENGQLIRYLEDEQPVNLKKNTNEGDPSTELKIKFTYLRNIFLHFICGDNKKTWELFPVLKSLLDLTKREEEIMKKYMKIKFPLKPS